MINLHKKLWQYMKQNEEPAMHNKILPSEKRQGIHFMFYQLTWTVVLQ